MSNKVRFAKVTFMLIFAMSICSSISFAYTLPGLALSNSSPVLQNHPASNCPAIPAHFDFLHASEQELHYYGILSRPRTSDQQATASWLKEVQGIKKTVCLSQSYAQPAMFRPGEVLTAAPTTDTACENPPAGTECSANWAGYIEGNGTQPGFNDIYAYWNVPCVTTSKSSDSAVSTWVGLGGGHFSGDSNLWQAGSGWDSTHNSYYIWEEAVGPNGNNGEQIIDYVNCGNHLRVEVWFAPGNPSSGIGGQIMDFSTNTLYNLSAPSGFTTGHLSAEWIDEKPGCAGHTDGFFRLADYNYTQWSAAYSSPNNATAPFYAIGTLVHTRVWTDNNGDTTNRVSWSDYLGSNTGSPPPDNYTSHWITNGTSHLCG